MNARLAALAAAALALALAGCVTQAKFASQVEADSDVDFAGYKTYAFPEGAHSESTSLAYSPEMVSRTQAVFARRLEAEGLRRVFTERDADLVVSYGITARSGTEIRVVPMSWSRFHDTNVGLQSMDAYGMHDVGYDEVREDKVTAGMLVLELWDNRASRVAWRVWVTGEIKDDRNQNFAGLEHALIEAFEKFPPPPKTK
jgi:hypothetical protein